MNTLISKPTNQPLKFIRTVVVADRIGLSKSTIRRLELKGLFVKPCSLGERSIAYIESEVDSLLSAMAAGKSSDEIKALVISLTDQRQHLAA